MHDQHTDQELRAEPQGLAIAALGQLGAADAVREAGIVLDPRAGARLTTGRVQLDDQRAKPLGGGVHGRRQAGGAGAEDHQVVAIVPRARWQAHPGRKCGSPVAGGDIGLSQCRVEPPRRGLGEERGRLEAAAVGEQREWPLAGGFDRLLGEEGEQRVAVEIDPVERCVVAFQELACRLRCRLAASAKKRHRLH